MSPVNCFAGQKEVKVLVDLAMISAQGQSDLEVQRVEFLHTAAMGYAPLIYDMHQNIGFKEFLPLCQAVWRTLEVDDQLPKKFVRFLRILSDVNDVSTAEILHVCFGLCILYLSVLRYCAESNEC